MSLKCLTCEDREDQLLFTYSESKKVINIQPDTPYGVYQLELSLSDDNADNSLTTTASFSVFIKKGDTPEFIQEFIKEMEEVKEIETDQ